MPLRLAIVVALFSASAFSQARMGSFGPGTLAHFGARPLGIAHNHHHFYPGYGYYALPDFYSDYEPYVDYVPEPPSRPEPVPQVKIEPAPDPVLLELHGNQWVKVTNFNETSGHVASTGVPSQVSTKTLPPVVLVFRDGHMEEVKSYSIIGPTIYAKADYWTTGKWTRAIHLANLNIPATIERNHARGLNFELPSSPDEIMLRP